MRRNKIQESKISLRALKESTKSTMFRMPINKRKNKLGKILYKGWSIELYKTDDAKVLIPYINIYFTVESKASRTGKRVNYMQIIQLPYKQEYRSEYFSSFYDETPVKIFSSDPSFQYFLAFALNKVNGVVINNETTKHLGIALTKKPTVRNATLHKELNKHMYKLIEFISSKKLNKYINEKTYLGMNKMPTSPDL